MSIAGNGGLSWLVVRCKQRRETVACDHLRRQAFEPYLPMLLTRRKRLGQWSDVREPLFPGYLFLGVRCMINEGRRDTIIQNVRPVRSTREVLGIIRVGLELAAVPRSEIQALREREALGRQGSIEDPRLSFARGEQVRIAAGPLTGAHGTLQRTFGERSGERRAIVLLAYMRTTQSVSLPIDMIAKA